VRAETDAVFGCDEELQGMPSREACDTMHTTLGTLKETLRFYSVVPNVTRLVVDRDTLGGYQVCASLNTCVS
jgi:cytochrome P450